MSNTTNVKSTKVDAVDILLLKAVTPVHAGTGSELSFVDLPIQREKATGFPIIQGSSLKGALRTLYWRKVKKNLFDEVKLATIFGPGDDLKKEEFKEASSFASAASFSNANVLFFPVRSLKGTFALVTCPLVLRRFIRDYGLIVENADVQVPVLNGMGVLVPEGSTIKLSKGNEKKVVLESYVLDVKEDREQGKDLQKLWNVLKKVAGKVQADFSRLAIVSDDLFTYFVRYSTEIIPRIKLKKDTGVVDNFWYEEHLPAETVLWSVVRTVGARGKPIIEKLSEDLKKIKIEKLETPEGVLSELRETLNNYFQLGGDFTTGKGLLYASFLGEKE